MTKAQYEVFEALNPFFGVVLKGLRGLVDGKHYFDAFAEEALFESRYHFPGWPPTIRGRANLMEGLTGYGKTIKPHSADALVVHRSRDSRVVNVVQLDSRAGKRLLTHEKGCKNVSFCTIVGFSEIVQFFWNEWRGRRDSNSRPLPSSGRSLDLRVTASPARERGSQPGQYKRV